MRLTVDGAEVLSTWQAEAEIVVIGSGPAGAMYARTLAEAGADVLVLEEGPLVPRTAFHADSFGAMRQLYRDLGASVTRGRAPLPVVQGRAVGGTSVINGAISWRLPEDVWQRWAAADPALSEYLPWDELVATTEQIEADLGIAPTPAEVQGRNDRLMAAGAEALGLDHRPIRRNVKQCAGSGRCLLGCPSGAKQSMDVSYLPRAVSAGARLAAGMRVDRIDVEAGRVVGVRGTTAGGAAFTVRAAHVVVAASAVHSPLLLWRSGVRQGPVGEHFRAHPGFSMLGRFPDEVRAWEGSTQGHEVTGLRGEGLKFEALGLDAGMIAARIGAIGTGLRRAVDEDLPHLASWAVAVKAGAEGRVRPSWLGSPVRYDLSDTDLAMARRGLRVLGEMMLAAGAEYVRPGVSGFDPVVRDPRRLAALESEGPRDPRAYTGVMTHLFGSCRMHSDPASGVVDLAGRHHHVRGLSVVDSSVFPTNTGVNPQTSILGVSRMLALRAVRSEA